jgi:hypothetical protein
MTDPPDVGARERLAKEQFEALGRFVQAFEHLVDEVRTGCVFFVAAGGADPAQRHRAGIAFHHHSLTAVPLLEILRALVGDYMLEAARKVERGDREVVRAVLSQIAGEYQDLSRKRNDIVHGTWFIGWAEPARESEGEMVSMKFGLTPDGLTPKKLPESATAMHALVAACDRLREEIKAVRQSLLLYHHQPMRPRSRFSFVPHPKGQKGGRWETAAPASPAE